MLYFIITIFAIGLIIVPLAGLYVWYQARKSGSKFADKDYSMRFRAKMILLSIAIGALSLLLLYLFRDNL